MVPGSIQPLDSPKQTIFFIENYIAAMVFTQPSPSKDWPGQKQACKKKVRAIRDEKVGTVALAAAPLFLNVWHYWRTMCGTIGEDPIKRVKVNIGGHGAEESLWKRHHKEAKVNIGGP